MVEQRGDGDGEEEDLSGKERKEEVKYLSRPEHGHYCPVSLFKVGASNAITQARYRKSTFP